jgi:hypothetical protein
VLYRSVVQSSENSNHRNHLLAFKPDVQDRINRLDVKPSPITRNNNHTQKIRGPNDDVSKRTWSKVGHMGQNIGDSTRFKL